jgi:hypothetical protein
MNGPRIAGFGDATYSRNKPGYQYVQAFAALGLLSRFGNVPQLSVISTR